VSVSRSRWLCICAVWCCTAMAGDLPRADSTQISGLVNAIGQPKSSAESGGDTSPELVTDRPDFTESVEVVGTGTLQFESGFTINSEAGVRSFSGPELLMRAGISRRVELRFGDEGFLMEKEQGVKTRSGDSDIELAAKIKVFEESKFRPAFSLIPLLSVPTGGRSFSSHGYDPTMKFAWSKGLIKHFDLGGNVNVSSLTSSQGRFTQTGLSWSVGHDLSKNIGAYWEVFTFSPWDKGTSAAWIANTGLTRKIGRDAQVDVRIGRRITAIGPDWFFGMGFSFRDHLFRGSERTSWRQPS
jgi:Putative MetA-pathway of phenol degradation